MPRQRNATRVLLLIDRQGSMTPFHRVSDQLSQALHRSANLDHVSQFYFHNVPAEGADDRILAPLADQLFPTMDSVLAEIKPLMTGYLYQDTELLEPQPLADILPRHFIERWWSSTSTL